jgi:hypothetical protein
MTPDSEHRQYRDAARHGEDVSTSSDGQGGVQGDRTQLAAHRSFLQGQANAAKERMNELTQLFIEKSSSKKKHGGHAHFDEDDGLSRALDFDRSYDADGEPEMESRRKPGTRLPRASIAPGKCFIPQPRLDSKGQILKSRAASKRRESCLPQPKSRVKGDLI